MAEGDIVVSYEDADGNVTEKRTPISVNVVSYDYGNDDMDGMTEDDMPTDAMPESTGFPSWAWFVIGGVVIAAGAIVAVVVVPSARRRRWMTMKWTDLIRLSFTNLWRRKTRTILTMIGTMIGTASIVVMVSLGIGINQGYIDSMAATGELTNITVNSQTYYGGGGMVSDIGTGNSVKAVKLTMRWCASSASWIMSRWFLRSWISTT